MEFWTARRRALEVAEALRPLAVRADELRLPCAVIERAPGVPSATGSFLGGHPYRPAGLPWPSDDEGPMPFVCQLSFAEVPALPEFPRHGLLQWFVSNDDTMGLTFDDTQGSTGFHVEWFADVSAPSVANPTADTPVAADAYTPVSSPSPVRLGFRSDVDLPCWDELEATHPEFTEDVAWERIEEDLGDDRDALWDVRVRGGDRSRVGGYANFTQFDPRVEGPWAGSAHVQRLIVELDSQDGLTGWGDGGIGHLFGDPARLADGDLSTITYHWDCM